MLRIVFKQILKSYHQANISALIQTLQGSHNHEKVNYFQSLFLSFPQLIHQAIQLLFLCYHSQAKRVKTVIKINMNIYHLKNSQYSSPFTIIYYIIPLKSILFNRFKSELFYYICFFSSKYCLFFTVVLFKQTKSSKNKIYPLLLCSIVLFYLQQIIL